MARKPSKKVATRRLTRGRTPPAAATGPVTLDEARALARGPEPKHAPKRDGDGDGDGARTLAQVGADRKQRAVAHRAEVHRRQAEYKATLAIMKKRGVKGLAPLATGAGKRRAPGAAHAPTSQPLQLFAEGDSWFDYPVPFFGGGIVPRLEKELGVPILNLAKAGDEVRYMLGVEERRRLAKQLQSGCPAGGPWDVLLFSGGGNDIVDNPMALWVRDYRPGALPANLIHQPRFDASLALVRAGYEDLIDLRNQLSPPTQLVFQGYDFAIPDGRGLCNLGPWLKPTFKLRGFPSDAAAFPVVKLMLQQFAAMLTSLEATHAGVTFINGQGTLPVQKTSWHNELHPSRHGFDLFAGIFRQRLKALFPGRVL